MRLSKNTRQSFKKLIKSTLKDWCYYSLFDIIDLLLGVEKMKLEDIKNPKFLKDMDYQELNELSTDIRKFLIENISKTGGHLSSNLGIVELTMAIHRNFNCPKDKIIFDVGHQAYVHKILTGRAKEFKTLRKLNGLSGFQKMS